MNSIRLFAAECGIVLYLLSTSGAIAQAPTPVPRPKSFIAMGCQSKDDAIALLTVQAQEGLDKADKRFEEFRAEGRCDRGGVTCILIQDVYLHPKVRTPIGFQAGHIVEAQCEPEKSTTLYQFFLLLFAPELWADKLMAPEPPGRSPS